MLYWFTCILTVSIIVHCWIVPDLKNNCYVPEQNTFYDLLFINYCCYDCLYNAMIMSIRKNKYIIIELISCFFILQELESESDQSKLFWLVIVHCQSVSQVSQSTIAYKTSLKLLGQIQWNFKGSSIAWLYKITTKHTDWTTTTQCIADFCFCFKEHLWRNNFDRTVRSLMKLHGKLPWMTPHKNTTITIDQLQQQQNDRLPVLL